MSDINTTDSAALFENKYFYQCEWHNEDTKKHIVDTKFSVKSSVDDMVKTIFAHEDYSWFRSDSPADMIYDCLDKPQPKILKQVKNYHASLHTKNGPQQMEQYLTLKSLLEKTTSQLIDTINNNGS